MPDTGLAEAAAVADRIRTAVDRDVFHENRDTGRVTVSVGVATQQGPGVSFKGLFKAADAALYTLRRNAAGTASSSRRRSASRAGGLKVPWARADRACLRQAGAASAIGSRSQEQASPAVISSSARSTISSTSVAPVCSRASDLGDLAGFQPCERVRRDHGNPPPADSGANG